MKGPESWRRANGVFPRYASAVFPVYTKPLGCDFGGRPITEGTMAYAVVYGADERVARCETATECRELVLALQLKGEQTIVIFDEQGAEVTLGKLK